MKAMRTRLAATVCGLSIALAVGGVATPAAAEPYDYPGGVRCSTFSAATESLTEGSLFGGSVQHRAQGYSGYHYASWPAHYWMTPYKKNWGWKEILGTRLGLTNGGTIIATYVHCRG